MAVILLTNEARALGLGDALQGGAWAVGSLWAVALQMDCWGFALCVVLEGHEYVRAGGCRTGMTTWKSRHARCRGAAHEGQVSACWVTV